MSVSVEVIIENILKADSDSNHERRDELCTEYGVLLAKTMVIWRGSLLSIARETGTPYAREAQAAIDWKPEV